MSKPKRSPASESRPQARLTVRGRSAERSAEKFKVIKIFFSVRVANPGEAVKLLGGGFVAPPPEDNAELQIGDISAEIGADKPAFRPFILIRRERVPELRRVKIAAFKKDPPERTAQVRPRLRFS